jgi:hypothetical protein
MDIRNALMAAGLVLSAAASCHAEVSAEEAKQLGGTLTFLGAEVAGNKDGTIPPYTGGLVDVPDSVKGKYKPGSGRYPDPFADDKPLAVVTAQNMGQYADKLSEGAKELFKRYPNYRMNVYQTRRTIAFPKYYQDSSIQNATRAKVSNNGLTVTGAWGGTPFPIPKSGVEVMWNRLLSNRGMAFESRQRLWYVDATGKAVSPVDIMLRLHYMVFNSDAKPGKFYYQSVSETFGPARIAGTKSIVHEGFDASSGSGRIYWNLVPGQRRVRLAPDQDYDTPVTAAAGTYFYEDISGFYGSVGRHDFKLIGKKEMLIPYNSHRMQYEAPLDKLLTKGVLNPDYARWELHRVWVVEAKPKAGVRHAYSKRMFYFDEDSWGAGATDSWDQSGKLYRSAFIDASERYGDLATNDNLWWVYDFSSGAYSITQNKSDPDLYTKSIPPMPAREVDPEAMAANAVR